MCDEEPSEIVVTAVATVVDGYADNLPLRTLVQLVPGIGGTLDMLMSERGSALRWERVEHTISALRERLDGVENLTIPTEDELFDLAGRALESAARTRHSEKRVLFARILAHQITEGADAAEAEVAVRMIDSLDAIQVEVLGATLSAPLCDEPFQGLRVVALEDPRPGAQGQRPLIISGALPHRPPEILRYALAELMSRGLLKDEGIGRYDTRGMTYFTPTETAVWLAQWIQE